MGKAVPKVAGYAVLLSLLWSLAASIALIALAGLYQHLERVPEWSLPFQWFLYGHAYYGRPGVGHDLGMSAAIASVLCIAAAVSAYTRPKKALFGESHFATDEEAKKSGLVFSRRPLGDAFLLGRTRGVLGFGGQYVSLPGEEHVSLYARTRSGKGVSVVVPNALNWGGSLVAFSISVTWCGMRRRSASGRAKPSSCLTRLTRMAGAIGGTPWATSLAVASAATMPSSG
jgi:type IV secretory pathway TraG/TraD family ATPase VirD4